MKSNKKTMIIIAILVVVFCIYWFGFRKTNSKDVADGSDTDKLIDSSAHVDKTSTDSIVDSLGLPNNVKTLVKNKAREAMGCVKSNTDWGKSIIGKASSNGVNSAQQCVCEALYLYYQDGLLTSSDYEGAVQKVKEL